MKCDKIHWGMIISSMAAAFALAVTIGDVRADVISEHNEQHAAEQAAENRLYDAGCIRTNKSRIERFRVITDGDGYRVLAFELSIKCVKWQGTPVAVITWSNATAREDGSTLHADQIRGVQIFHNGKIIAMAPGIRYKSETISPGDDVRLATVDANGVVSAWASARWQ